MKIRCIILEDEPLAQERLRSFAEKVPFLQVDAVFGNALEGIAYLKSHAVDLLFLDIRMDEISGIQLLESVQPRCEVIITTAYTDYAIKGYELRVTDYLLKPFSFERFLQAVNRIQDMKLQENRTEERKFIFVKTEYRLEKILLDDLLYIEGMRDYRCIHTKGKKIMTLQTFGDFEQQVPAHILCRVHKSYMIAPAKIESVERDRIRIGNQLIPISETYRKAFFELIGFPDK